MKNSNKPTTDAMSERKGPLIINLKNYLEISGDKALSLTREAERVSERTDIEIILSPPLPLLAWITKNTKLSKFKYLQNMEEFCEIVEVRRNIIKIYHLQIH